MDIRASEGNIHDYVEFADESGAEKAVDKNYHNILG